MYIVVNIYLLMFSQDSKHKFQTNYFLMNAGTEIQRLALRKNFMGQTSVPLDFLNTDATFTIHITRSKIIIKMLFHVANRHACHYH